jgi:hypothetical protein
MSSNGKSALSLNVMGGLGYGTGVSFTRNENLGNQGGLLEVALVAWGAGFLGDTLPVAPPRRENIFSGVGWGLGAGVGFGVGWTFNLK